MAKYTNVLDYVMQQASRCRSKKPCQCSMLHLSSRLCSTLMSPVVEPKLEDLKITHPQRKLLKVAFTGKSNAGKSTLINQIMNLNVCDVSCKTHTTRFPVRAAFIRENTQIVFIDTPGCVSQKEIKRFKLSESFINWRDRIFEEADVIGVIQEAILVDFPKTFHSSLAEVLNHAPKSKPLFLVLNKVDLLKNKSNLLKITEQLRQPQRSESDDSTSSFTLSNKFSKIFFVSALKNDGVSDVLDYLLHLAKESDWLFKPHELCDISVEDLVINLLRSKIMDCLPYEVPYVCSYETEYLSETNLGEFVGVALITCKYPKHQRMILRRRSVLPFIAKSIESDLFKIYGKVVRLRIVVTMKS